MKAQVNGRFVDCKDAKVSILSHSFSRGSSVFDVVSIWPTAKGGAFFRLKEHVARMFESARLVHMDIPMSPEEVTDAVVATAAENGVSFGMAKFFTYYPVEEFLILPANPKVELAVFCFDFDREGVTIDDLVGPVSAGISTIMKLDPRTIPIHAKITANYVNGMLALMEVRKKGCEQAILPDTSGFIAESPMANVFFVENGKILTPTLNNTLGGVTRDGVIRIARNLGFEVVETDIRPERIADFDEAFLTACVWPVRPIISIDSKPVGGECPGPVTRELARVLGDAYEGRSPQYESWLTYVE
ncbi:MAG: aminotransferase class IV [Planctomycetota bacterium]|nr:aminotransferase class IV [Planctomycetota bacterium]